MHKLPWTAEVLPSLAQLVERKPLPLSKNKFREMGFCEEWPLRLTKPVFPLEPIETNRTGAHACEHIRSHTQCVL